MPLDLSDSRVAPMMARIEILSRSVWEGRVSVPDVERWLANFDGRVVDTELEQINALQLLAHFSYFGSEEVRQLLRSMYRELYRYPLIQRARRLHGGTRDAGVLGSQFDDWQSKTRFVGLGNPSESGTHLLYYFRQESHLPAGLFSDLGSLLQPVFEGRGSFRLVDDIEILIVIDDVLGSGDQIRAAGEQLDRVRTAATTHGRALEIWYLTLFATSSGMAVARGLDFDHVDTIHEITDPEYAFSEQSHVYSAPPQGVTLTTGEAVAGGYGALIAPGHPFGHGEGQLLLGLHHNVPDNTLPIFWENESVIAWQPIFKRHRKVE